MPSLWHICGPKCMMILLFVCGHDWQSHAGCLLYWAQNEPTGFHKTSYAGNHDGSPWLNTSPLTLRFKNVHVHRYLSAIHKIIA